MGSSRGFLFVINEVGRISALQEYVTESWEFTDTVSAPDWGIGQREVFLVSLGGRVIHFAALVRRGSRVATKKDRIRFSEYVIFEPPIAFDSVAEHVEPRLRHHFLRSTQGGGSAIPPATWNAVGDAVRALRPRAREALDRLDRLREQRPILRSQPGLEIVTQERDAVNLALRMSGMDKGEVLGWERPKDGLAPFVQGLSRCVLREDQMIAHDAQVFGDWKQVSRYLVGSASFERNGDHLTIMNVNRHPVEETLGVDLLYYHGRYASYVMVQYKRMERENRELIYRPTDRSYARELKRMQDFERRLTWSHRRSDSGLSGYRLHNGFFFFKLCPADGFDPLSSEMVRGLYIPLDYWEMLVEAPDTLGPRGGRCITYGNVGRHFNNSLFIELVQEGWIGSVTAHTDVITEAIAEAVHNDRSVVLAAAQAPEPP